MPEAFHRDILAKCIKVARKLKKHMYACRVYTHTNVVHAYTHTHECRACITNACPTLTRQVIESYYFRKYSWNHMLY